jgi:hypothetical protein
MENNFNLYANEINDFVQLAPKRLSFSSSEVIAVRQRWLASISTGEIHEKINRRAGIVFAFKPWKNPIKCAILRHRSRIGIRKSA